MQAGHNSMLKKLELAGVTFSILMSALILFPREGDCPQDCRTTIVDVSNALTRSAMSSQISAVGAGNSGPGTGHAEVYSE